MTPIVVLFRPGKGPFKRNEFVICSEQHQAEAMGKLGEGFIAIVPQEYFDQVEAWRDRK